MPKMNSKGPESQGAQSGRKMGLCSGNTPSIEEMGKGMGMRRRKSGGKGKGMRRLAGSQN